MSGTGIDVEPNTSNCPPPALMVLLKCSVPVAISYQTYRSVRYRYGCRTEHNKRSGTGIDAVPNSTQFLIPVCCRTEHTDVSGTGSTGGIYRPCMYRTYLVFHGSTNFCILKLVLCRINRSCLCHRTRRQRPPRQNASSASNYRSIKTGDVESPSLLPLPLLLGKSCMSPACEW